MQGIRLGQPYMPVDPRALIEPAVAKARIHARHNAILRAVAQKIRHVEAERRIAVVIAANKATIHKDQNAAEGAVKLNIDPASQIVGRNRELPPVPAHARFWIATAQRLVAVRLLRFIVDKG